MATHRVMTINLRRDLPQDGRHQWHHRKPILIDMLHTHAPDIIATQEGLPHQLTQLDQALPTHQRIGRCRQGNNTDEACAIYISRNRYAINNWHQTWLSDTPHTPASTTWGNRHPRIATTAHLTDHTTNEHLKIVNTHLDHESAPARLHAARYLTTHHPNAILLGDLNATPNDEPHQHLLAAGWHDADARQPTYHAFTGQAHLQLDHILAPTTHTIRRLRVIHHEHNGIHASDHHAVIADIT